MHRRSSIFENFVTNFQYWGCQTTRNSIEFLFACIAQDLDIYCMRYNKSGSLPRRFQFSYFLKAYSLPVNLVLEFFIVSKI